MYAYLGSVAGVGCDENHLVATAGQVQACVLPAEYPHRLLPLHVVTKIFYECLPQDLICALNGGLA